ncbi:RICIN domain-containing protein [Streptomyces gilvifuscus]|uniref:RICIN domain-containing protein n=1 Tax=Streptomyces gilvifuscus TaxID=1550617 RepID=A0ABT5G006_9ACTN|nr:RICIN domain-containing protein [Streptomyces gilvifuscus]MDC2958129.1 RICIN domain-containing protein [Streptomyces gilvifuscus]
MENGVSITTRGSVLGRLAIGLSATAGLLLSSPGTGSATDMGVLTISGPANVANTGRCWDLGSNAPGAEVVLYNPCHYEDTYSSQKWYRTIDSNQVFNIQNANNLCMDLRSNAIGAHVIMAPCHYEDSYLSQKWYPDGTQPRHFRNSNGLCMDSSNVNGGPITMEPCNYNTNYQDQRWWTTGGW